MADLRKYFQVLGLLPTAGIAEIKKAYKRMAKAHHPDRFDDPVRKVLQEEMMKFQIAQKEQETALMGLPSR